MVHGDARKPRPWYRTWMALAIAFVLLLTIVAFLMSDKHDTDPDVAPERLVQTAP